MTILLYAFILLACLMPSHVLANPGQTGSTGLINVPSAETLDAGNICLGVWSCYSRNSNFSKESSLVLPVSITLGIGTFWEVFGTYPNILFNGDEDFSGRGTLDIGTKLRFLGGRSAAFKVAADFIAQRHISENRAVDGVTDFSGKLIASYSSKESLGLHLTAGYFIPGSLNGVSLNNGFTFGAGAEYMLMSRLKLLAEFTAQTNRYYIDDDPAVSKTMLDVSAGAQYYLSPHLTVNASAVAGLGSNNPDVKFILGISSCQGVGSYVTPIPSVGRRPAVKDTAKDALKPLKIVPISTLLLKASAAKSSPSSKLEVEVDGDSEEILIKPYGQITISPQQASSNLTSPVIPVEIPQKTMDDEILLNSLKPTNLEASAIDYTLNRIRGITPLYGVDVKGYKTSASVNSEISEKMAVYRKFSFPDSSFDFDQWTISSDGKKMLSEVAEQIRKDKKWLYLKIDGHTDNVGSVAYNMELSLKRATAAATYLINHEGIEPSKIFVKGFGKSAAVADNNLPEGRRKNRRTEIHFLTNRETP